MRSYYPKVRTLLLAWAALMALTIGTMVAGRVTDTNSLGVGWMVALGVITWAKAGMILRNYLNLRTAPTWLDVFMAYLLILLVLVVGLFAFANAKA